MATKKVTEVIPDNETAHADIVAGKATNIVDTSTIPAPITDEVVSFGMVAGDVNIDPADGAKMDSMMAKAAAAMGSAGSDTTQEPIEGEYLMVFYHIPTRRYVQYNPALSGRADFEMRKVKSTEAYKLGMVG